MYGLVQGASDKTFHSLGVYCQVFVRAGAA